MTSVEFAQILKPICDKYQFTNNYSFSISYRGLTILGLPPFFEDHIIYIGEDGDVEIILQMIQSNEHQLSKLIESNIKTNELKSLLTDISSCLNNINLPLNVLFYNYQK